MPEMTMQVLRHMLEHNPCEQSDNVARAMIGAALSYFQARLGEDATVAMMLDDIKTVREISSLSPDAIGTTRRDHEDRA